MSRGVNSESQAADHHDIRTDEFSSQACRAPETLGARFPPSYDRHSRAVEQLHIPDIVKEGRRVPLLHRIEWSKELRRGSALDLHSASLAPLLPSPLPHAYRTQRMISFIVGFLPYIRMPMR